MVTVGLVGMPVLAACGSSQGSSAPSSGTAAAPTQQDGAVGTAAPEGTTGDTAKQPGTDSGSTSGSTKSGGSPGQPIGPTDARAIVQTGEITVKVTDVAAAAERASALVVAVNGLIAADSRDGGGSASKATVVLRVPPESFRRVVDQVAALGTEQSRQLRSEDVTDAVVDLDARIAGQQASVDRIRQLLSRAGSVTDIAAVERELATRESDLAVLQAQKRTLASKITYSTLTVTLFAPGAVVGPPTPAKRGFLGGLQAGWHAFLAVGTAFLTAFGALLPFFVPLGLLCLVLWLVLRRGGRLRRRTVVPPPDNPPSP
jgi:hypothetical protein